MAIAECHVTQDDDDLRSEFDFDPEVEQAKRRRQDLAGSSQAPLPQHRASLPSKELVVEEYNKLATRAAGVGVLR